MKNFGSKIKTSSTLASPSSSFSSLHSQTSLSASKSFSGSFVELLARSNFSFLQGGSHPEEMVLRAKQLKYKGLALCDQNGLYGIVRGHQAATQPSAFDTSQLAESSLEDGSPSADFQYISGVELTPYDSQPVVLIPMNKDGYTQLCHLITLAKRRAPKGQIVLSLKDILQIGQTADHVIAFPLPPWKEADLVQLQNSFQDRLYLPVHRDFTWEAMRFFQSAIQFEKSMGLQLFATGRPLYHVASRKPLHDVLTCIHHKTTLDEATTLLTLNRERYMKPLAEMATLFQDRLDLLERTNEIAARISFDLRELRYKYPTEALPFGTNATDFLNDLVGQGIEWRYPPSSSVRRDSKFMAKVHSQIRHELKLIDEMEYEDYFLTLWDICKFARDNGILHQGRGSAANSIVCFMLGLTSIDPVHLGLLFERFISKERGEPPDIDIDFEHERREEVIQYIYRKYGERHAAMVCTVITYRSRMAVREVAKVMGLPLPKIDALIKFMGREGISRLLENPGNIEKYGLTQAAFDCLLALSVEMQGFPRHLGIHSGGFVISHEAIINIVPVESATMDGRYVIQWNKDDISTLGLMKIDVLSLGMLTALRKSLELLKNKRGIDMNLATIPPDCQETYRMIQKADTVGVFQIESRAQMSLLPRLKPKCYYDLVIEIAIVRPGPIQGGMVHPYLKRRSGTEKITYAHPSLIPVLQKTLGIPLFQEQIMQIVSTVAGFTPGEADELRRIMSSAWKKQPIMDGLRARVLSGMMSNGLSLAYAEQIYKTIEGFSSYGFPESHSASFALITYASCYLKHHYPDIFTCALLNSQPMGFYPPRQLIADAQRHGVQFRALDVQASSWDYEIEGVNCVRAGFRAIYGLPEASMKRLTSERLKHGGFRDLQDLVKRTGLSRAIFMRLAAAGALESMKLSARESIWTLQAMNFDAQSFFYGSSNQEETSLLPKEDEWESIKREYSTKGFSIENHPMAILRQSLFGYTTSSGLMTLRHKSRVRVAGLMSMLQKPPTAKGMCFVSLEDETGILNIVITPDIYQKHRLAILSASLLEVAGILENYEGVRNIKAIEILPLKSTLAVGKPRDISEHV